jgi:hypothetical protein
MDKLNVPLAGERGAKFYKDKTLLFSRKPDGSFAFHVGNQRDQRQKQELGSLMRSLSSAPTKSGRPTCDLTRSR